MQARHACHATDSFFNSLRGMETFPRETSQAPPEAPDSFFNSLRGMETIGGCLSSSGNITLTASLIPSGEWKRGRTAGLPALSGPDSFFNSLRGMETH